MIRSPRYFRGRGCMSIGRGFTTGVGIRLDAFPDLLGGGQRERIVLKIGRNVEINDYVHISAVANVVIGDDVLIASRVFVTDHNHGAYSGGLGESNPAEPPRSRPLSFAPVVIGDRVWIGEGVSVMPGVSIGEGTVIAAGAVVTRSIPANVIAAGVPARVIKRYNCLSGTWESA